MLRWGQAPFVYPFPKPFHDTPHDEDRFRYRRLYERKPRYPDWMDRGMPGTQQGAGLHRAHPLSHLRGNLRRGKEDVPRVLKVMLQGIRNHSGGPPIAGKGKVPNPSQFPYVTGEPDKVYNWKVTDPEIIRKFEMPHIEPEKRRYKAYVAMQEQLILGDAPSAKGTDVVPEKPKPAKPLLKRLFFWK